MRFSEQFRVLIRPSNYDESVAFYRDTLGLSVFRSWDDAHGRGTVFQAGSGLIEVELGRGTSGTPGFKGVVIQVDDADEVYQEVLARGAPATEPVTAPWGHRLFHANAPDGLRLIFFQEVQGA